MKRPSVLVASLAAAGLSALSTPAHADLSQDVVARINAAISTYAPILHLHPDEKSMPTSADSFINTLTEATSDGGRRLKSGASTAGSLTLARAYVNLVVGNTFTDIQYWFTYPYNWHGLAHFSFDALLKKWSTDNANVDPCGRHEGDWEHITVRIGNADGKLQSVYLAQHDHGQRVTDVNKYLLRSDGRLHVFASKNGHAIYSNHDDGTHYNYDKNTNLGQVKFKLVNVVKGGGATFDARGKTILIGAQNKVLVVGNILKPSTWAKSTEDLGKRFGATTPSWMSITGRWGKIVNRTKTDTASMLGSSLGDVTKYIADLLGGAQALNNKIIDAIGLNVCTQENGPAPPWTKDVWTGYDD